MPATDIHQAKPAIKGKGALHISTHPADYDLAVEDQTANA